MLETQNLTFCDDLSDPDNLNSIYLEPGYLDPTKNFKEVYNYTKQQTRKGIYPLKIKKK